MPWPSPEVVLCVLGAFLFCYGISLSIRASRAKRWSGERSVFPGRCPDCDKPWPPAPAKSCAFCGVTPPARSAIRAARLWVILGILLSLAGVIAFLGGLQLAAWLHEERTAFGSARRGVTIGPILGAGFGLSFFGVYLALIAYRGQRSNGRRRCPKCWYLIDPALGLQCSECGHRAKRERDLYRPRRRWRLAALGLLIIVLGQLGWVETRVRLGGWLAAVPTEILILGMGWLPDYCIADGLAGAEEDWSLTGRFTDAWYSGEAGQTSWRVWSWHRSWAASRADARLRNATTLPEATAALELLVTIAGDRERGTLPPRHAPALIHAARLALPHLSGPRSAAAATVLQQVGSVAWVSRGDDLPGVPHPGLPEFVAESRDHLLPQVAGTWGWETISATVLLSMSNGEPEVIDALLDAVPSNRAARGSLTSLSMRLPHVAESLERTIRDPSDPRRGYAAASVTARVADGDAPESLIAALAERARDPDPGVALAASETLWRSSSDPLRRAAFDALIRAYKADASLGTRVLDLLTYRLHLVMPHAIPQLLDLAASADPDHRQFFLYLMLSEPDDADPTLAREAVRLLDAGTEAPAGFEPHAIDTLRTRARPLRSDSPPDAPPPP